MSWLRNSDENPEGKRTSETDASDAALVQMARRGDKRAFVEIVARHQAMVCGIALGILGDFAASEDAGQEAFLTAWRKIHELREPDRLRAWLAQIARNAALGQLRRRRAAEPMEQAPVLADDAPTPDEAAASEEDAALVRASLAKLPEAYRMPLILFYREGQSVRAVAESLAISEDAVKQRLARGREMLRDQMSGLVENVLTRTRPTTIFTMTIAAAIGALAAPAAVAAGVFMAAPASVGAAATSTTTTTPFLTAMSTSKTSLITAAFVTAVCIPVGYRMSVGPPSPNRSNVTAELGASPSPSPSNAPPSFESSALFAEWRGLHDLYGRTAEAMPAIYKAIAEITDPFRRRAFRAALMAEWVQIDAQGGLAFFLGKGSDTSQRRQFFEEWLALAPRAAVDALLASGPGWEDMARGSLSEIARQVPSRLPELVSRLPKPTSYWDASVQNAFAILAESGLGSARNAAEAMKGPNREQALAGVARAWAKTDLEGAIAWAKKLPEGIDHNEVIRAALIGKSAVDPVSALDQVGLVPPGGRQGYFATTTGARILREASKTDFDSTVAWIAAHPGRLGYEDMMGMADAVTERINANAVEFLNRHATDDSLNALMPAINSALLNGSSGQRAAVWEWLKTQPENDATVTLKRQVLSSAGYQDPALAMSLVNELPRTAEADTQVESLAGSLINNGSMLSRFESLLEEAPERLRRPLVEAAFKSLRDGTMDDPRQWIARLSLLPEESRGMGIESIARAWAEKQPEEAISWASTLTGDTRNGAVAAIASAWSRKDAHGAAEWIGSMPPGKERDRSAASLVDVISDNYPREAWDWALSIADPSERARAATHAAGVMGRRDPNTARQWIEAGPFTPDVRAQLHAALTKARQQ